MELRAAELFKRTHLKKHEDTSGSGRNLLQGLHGSRSLNQIIVWGDFTVKYNVSSSQNNFTKKISYIEMI